jgi:DNA modification methylase
METKKKYEDFLKSKQKKYIDSGFIIDELKLNHLLFDFQKFIVKRALEAGKYAIFADTGLGKTAMQLEWANQVSKFTDKPVLILAPLAVSGQTIKEAEKFNLHCERLKGDVFGFGVYINNYEQLHKIDVTQFSGIVLDESSILKNFTGKYKNLIIDSFLEVPYKLACTATPSPNDINEIGNHSEFLNILDAQDMRAKWFVRDEGMNNYRLKYHAKIEFYSWVGSWCTLITNPSQLGFTETGMKFNLPELNYIEKKVYSGKQDNGKLFNDMSVDATNFNRELRRTMLERMQIAADIANNSNEPFIIWINLNEEEKIIKNLVPDGVVVNGSEEPEKKEAKLLGFAKNEFRVLITKKKIAQFGLNYQHCNNQIFASLDFSFEGLYQSIRRSYRFGQKKDVNIYIITTDTMENVVHSIKRKEMQFHELQNELRYNVNQKYELVMDYNKIEYKTKDYHIIQGDTVVEIDNFKDNSIDFSIFSPPFSMLFTYSNSYRDMGNCESHSEFFEQNQYLLNKLYQKIKPGRLVAVHSKDLAVYKNSSGYTGLYDFTGEYHRAMEKAGFRYHSKITIWTDPVLEMQRTKTQRLLYKQLRSDSTFTGVGLPEYITLFKKWDGIAENGNSEPVNNKTHGNFPLDVWQNWASPVWGTKLKEKELIEMIEYYKELNGVVNEKSLINPEWFTGSWFDIRRTDVLNNKEGTDMGDEKHIAPLQLTVIRRAIQMWTNPGEVVFTPFMGIGSEVYCAVQLNRIGYGIELKPSYFEAAKKNIDKIINKQAQLTLFDGLTDFV